jgi:hypothetical protein
MASGLLMVALPGFDYAELGQRLRLTGLISDLAG